MLPSGKTLTEIIGYASPELLLSGFIVTAITYLGFVQFLPRCAPMAHLSLSESDMRRCGFLATSFSRWLKRPIIDDLPVEPLARAQALYEAPCVIVSHGTEPDPLFWFANRRALQLWDMDADAFIGMPSRLSAEPDEQCARDQLLARAARDGYIDDYHGVRISRTGKRFRIRDVILWNIHDDQAQLIGQAALFSQWDML